MRPLLAIAALSFVAAPALGQFSLTTYDVIHNFNWQPPPGVTVLPTVTGASFQHVWLRDSVGFSQFATIPAAQNPGFDGFGTDLPAGLGADNFPAGGGPSVPCVFVPFPIPATGQFTSHCLTLVSPNSNTFANACVEFDVSPYSIGSNISGRIRSAGSAGAFGPRARAFAFSSAGFSIVDASSTGAIQWTPVFDSVAGSAFAQSNPFDPIAVIATDVNGITAQQIILEIDYLSQGSDTFSWSAGVLSINSQNGRFHARVIGPVALNPGEFLIEIQGGVVTAASSSGWLGFPVPPLGAPSPVAVPLPNDIGIRYDAQQLFADPVTSTTLVFLGGGNAPSEAPPCGSADFDCDGDAGTDADIEAFFACLGGLCPEPTCGSTADFDGDGDAGTDADIESFFSVLGGGPC